MWIWPLIAIVLHSISVETDNMPLAFTLALLTAIIFCWWYLSIRCQHCKRKANL